MWLQLLPRQECRVQWIWRRSIKVSLAPRRVAVAWRGVSCDEVVGASCVAVTGTTEVSVGKRFRHLLLIATHRD